MLYVKIYTYLKLAPQFQSWIKNFCENEYFENLATVNSGYWKVFWKIDFPKISRNIERLQIRAKPLNQAHNLQLCIKINFTSSIFQFICLLFKNTCLSQKKSFKEKSKNFETQGILCYSRCIALRFQQLQLVRLTNRWLTF